MENKVTFELINFSKKYGDSKKFTVENINLKVHDGEIVGFLGPNGAGKSTTIKSIIGINNLTSGEIKLCGHDLNTEPEIVKSLIGYVPDQYILYEKLTGNEYLHYLADLYKVDKSTADKRINEYAERFYIIKALNRPIETYSHGMKQKIGLIASLIHQPKLWILDEPLTGLDPITVMQVKQTMIEYANKGNIVFFSSHIINIVHKLCTRVVILHNKKIQQDIQMSEIDKKGILLEKFYLDTINQ